MPEQKTPEPKCFVHAKHRNCTGSRRWVLARVGVRLYMCERGIEIHKRILAGGDDVKGDDDAQR